MNELYSNQETLFLLRVGIHFILAVNSTHFSLVGSKIVVRRQLLKDIHNRGWRCTMVILETFSVSIY